MVMPDAVELAPELLELLAEDAAEPPAPPAAPLAPPLALPLASVAPADAPVLWLLLAEPDPLPTSWPTDTFTAATVPAMLEESVAPDRFDCADVKADCAAVILA